MFLGPGSLAVTISISGRLITMDLEAQAKPRPFPPVSFDEFPPASYEEWKAEAEAALKGAPFEKLLFTKTYEGITLEPLYMESSIEGLTLDTLPGREDYLRGTSAAGYIQRPWAIAQSCDEVLPEDSNQAVKKELAGGSNTLHLILDRATTYGTSPAWADGESEPRGLSLSTLKDVDDLMADLDLSKNGIHVYAGPSSAPLLALLAGRARSQGRASNLALWSGCVGADPVGSLAQDGSIPCPMDQLMDEAALTIHWSRKAAPGLKTVLIRGDVYHDGGANGVQELACSMATAIEYLRAMEIRGLDVDSAASAMRFSFSLGANYFMEIAKLRAARVFWSQVVRAFGGKGDSAKMDIFASTSRFTQTVYDPYVNVLRATSQAFSGVVGGTDTLWVRRFDEAIRPGTEQSRRISRNIQILLQSEFNLTQPIDPAGGSYYVEKLTSQLLDNSWEAMQAIEAEGGMIKALQSGYVQREIDGVLQSRLKKLEVRSDRAVGTNMYPNVTEKPLEGTTPDLREIAAKRAASVESYRELTDEVHRKDKLGMVLDSMAGEPEGFMENLVETFMAGATLYEVRQVLNDGFPGDLTVEPISPHRWTERFEALRKRTEEGALSGRKVTIFLANMGPLKQHKARADFSTSFMEVADFDVIRSDGFDSVEAAAAAAVASGATSTVICSTDDTYPELVPPLAKAIKEGAPTMTVLLAGSPAPEFKESYVQAGVDDFIHVKANCYAVLESLQRAGGIA